MSDMNADRMGTVEVARRTGYSARQIQRMAARIPGAKRTPGGHYTFAITDDLRAWIKAQRLLPGECGKPGRKKRLSTHRPTNLVLESHRISALLKAVGTEIAILTRAAEADAARFYKMVGRKSGFRPLDRYAGAGIINGPADRRNWKTVLALAKTLNDFPDFEGQ